MEGHCSTGQSPQWAVVPMEEEEGGGGEEVVEEEEEEVIDFLLQAIFMAATTAILWGPRNFFVEVWDPPCIILFSSLLCCAL